jgi:ribosomal-protein-alanine N-acetyltransferase
VADGAARGEDPPVPEPRTPVPDLTTPRLLLRRWSPEVAAAVVAGARLDGWAADFPAGGDREIARLLARDPGGPGWGRHGHRLLVERATGLVVGGAGLFPDGDGGLELGYGVVASRRGRGYATEAARALAGLALADGVPRVVAGVEPGNPASVRVLERIGMHRTGSADGADRYRLAAT